MEIAQARKRRIVFLILLSLAFLFRLGFGVCSEFWNADEKQIYLIGLKHYTTGAWPYFGPDVTSTIQVPGALQGLTTGLPFYLLPIPKAPYILLNILSFAALLSFFRLAENTGRDNPAPTVFYYGLRIMPEHFLTTAALTRDELEALIESALRFKRGEERAKPLAGRSIALVFFNPSLRTRASMQVGVFELGGNAVVLEPGGTSWTLEHREGAVMDGDKTEHVAEFVRVLGRYCAGLGVRTFAALKDWEEERRDPVLKAFAKYSDVPVINLESAMHHPCQALADMMTVREKLGARRKRVLLTWAWHPKPLPMAVPNSFALAAAQMGHDLVIAHPQGYELDDELMRDIESHAKDAGGSVSLTNEVNEAFDGVDVVYAKSWGSRRFYGAGAKDVEERASYRQSWIVDEEKMARTREAIFMHCLPVRRNVIVTDGVIDSPLSVVIDEAENRLHAQKAIMTKLLEAQR